MRKTKYDAFETLLCTCSGLHHVGGASRGWGPVGVAQHGVEGAGVVIGAGAAVVLVGQRHQAGQNQQQEEQQVEREGGAEHPPEEGGSGGGRPPLIPFSH